MAPTITVSLDLPRAKKAAEATLLPGAASEKLRQAGAGARSRLVAAAAQRWAVDPATCCAESDAVLHPPSGRFLPYGALAADAARLQVPEKVTLR